MAKDRNEETPKEAIKPDKEKLSLWDKLALQTIGKRRKLGDPEDPVAGSHPNLWRWMTETDVGQFHVKQPARLSVVAAPNGFGFTLTDPAYAVTVRGQTTRLLALWDSLEAMLSDPDTVSVGWGQKEPKVRKRKED